MEGPDVDVGRHTRRTLASFSMHNKVRWQAERRRKCAESGDLTDVVPFLGAVFTEAIAPVILTLPFLLAGLRCDRRWPRCKSDMPSPFGIPPVSSPNALFADFVLLAHAALFHERTER